MGSTVRQSRPGRIDSAMVASRKCEQPPSSRLTFQPRIEWSRDRERDRERDHEREMRHAFPFPLPGTLETYFFLNLLFALLTLLLLPLASFCSPFAHPTTPVLPILLSLSKSAPDEVSQGSDLHSSAAPSSCPCPTAHWILWEGTLKNSLSPDLSRSIPDPILSFRSPSVLNS